MNENESEKPCFNCDAKDKWRLMPSGKFICETCHPPAVSEEKIERFHIAALGIE